MANFGKNKILMFRKLGDKTAAAKLALQTEHKWKYERKNDSTATKDGSVVSDKGLEVTLSIEAVTSRDDVNKMLKNSVVNGEKLEVWEIDLAGEKQGEKYPALYAQGALSSWEVPDNVEDLETLSTEMTIEGKPAEGYATLTASQVEEINYAFKDTTVSK
ncbi:phage major tail protein, TP901-1 family [Streptococcus macedonicus]|uniref:Phage tail protein n=1 Tax=Streptococcus gallolyticus TaxID=315405 RepID=A0A380K667_9STRE|nr:phage major tail protein, TP901-1 family [Streptococcus macedonicus]WGK79929.1 phage major tail protein, TP901-1 family [Streptococcus macedonicus]SUN60167.1 Phage tail protein [Streptococcus gallolyticus]